SRAHAVRPDKNGLHADDYVDAAQMFPPPGAGGRGPDTTRNEAEPIRLGSLNNICIVESRAAGNPEELYRAAGACGWNRQRLLRIEIPVARSEPSLPQAGLYTSPSKRTGTRSSFAVAGSRTAAARYQESAEVTVTAIRPSGATAAPPRGDG